MRMVMEKIIFLCGKVFIKFSVENNGTMILAAKYYKFELSLELLFLNATMRQSRFQPNIWCHLGARATKLAELAIFISLVIKNFTHHLTQKASASPSVNAKLQSEHVL